MPEVWFIRHGESISNANLRTEHPAHSPLTPKGEAQAQAIVHAIPRKPDLIVVSPFERAQQTAVPTLNHFHPIPREEWPVHEFTYLAPIRYQGTTGEERRPFALQYWQQNDPDVKDGGEAESFAELLRRVRETIDRFQTHPAQFIVVFSHGLFLRAMLWLLLTGIQEATPRAMERYSHFVRAVHLPNGGIMKITFTPGEPTRLNPGFVTSHLS